MKSLKKESFNPYSAITVMLKKLYYMVHVLKVKEQISYSPQSD